MNLEEQFHFNIQNHYLNFKLCSSTVLQYVNVCNPDVWKPNCLETKQLLNVWNPYKFQLLIFMQSKPRHRTSVIETTHWKSKITHNFLLFLTSSESTSDARLKQENTVSQMSVNTGLPAAKTRPKRGATSDSSDDDSDTSNRPSTSK